jgi:hypothetical protein
MSKATRRTARKQDMARVADRQLRAELDKIRKLKGFRPASVGDMLDAVGRRKAR